MPQWVENYLRDHGLTDRVKLLRIYDMSVPRGAAHHSCHPAPVRKKKKNTAGVLVSSSLHRCPRMASPPPPCVLFGTPVLFSRDFSLSCPLSSSPTPPAVLSRPCPAGAFSAFLGQRKD